VIALVTDVPNRIGTERSREDQRLSEKPSLSQVRGISVGNFFSATGTHLRLHDVRYVPFLLSLKMACLADPVMPDMMKCPVRPLPYGLYGISQSSLRHPAQTSRSSCRRAGHRASPGHDQIIDACRRKKTMLHSRGSTPRQRCKTSVSAEMPVRCIWRRPLSRSMRVPAQVGALPSPGYDWQEDR
jgi:hypothetical protein